MRESRRVAFGEFVLDLRSGELRRGTARVPLPGQAFAVLTALLEQPAALVTREELHCRLWPGDTFVDFEHGLNAAVKRLRESLGDSAASPRFVETVPRRGYRFIAEVDGVPSTAWSWWPGFDLLRALVRLAMVRVIRGAGAIR